MTDHFDSEEDFHAKDRKQFRKERRLLQESDRSKYKKTNLVAKQVARIPEGAARGRVMAVTGEGIWVESSGVRLLCKLKGALKKEKLQEKNLVAVGDYVWCENDSIVHVEERSSVLARADVTGRKQQLIAVNVDQVFIVVSVVEPTLRPALVDRYLIAAYKGNLHPIIVVNKIDLLEESEDEKERYEEFVAAYEPLGIPILSLSSETGSGIDAFKFLMKDRTSVLAGQSGVGKSTLLNIAFQMSRRTGEVTTKTFKGAHTTSVAELIPLPEGGYCIDTPGIRSFGLWQLEREDVTTHFKEIAEFGEHCHFANCSHVFEPKCAVLAALKQGDVAMIRYESYCSLLDEALGGMDNRTKRKLEMPDE